MEECFGVSALLPQRDSICNLRHRNTAFHTLFYCMRRHASYLANPADTLSSYLQATCVWNNVKYCLNVYDLAEKLMALSNRLQF